MQNLRLPERFLRLKDEQQAGALVALQQVDEAQRQAVLDEWAARCHNSAVRNPAGYLFGIIQKAIRGGVQGLGRRKCIGAASAPVTCAHRHRRHPVRLTPRWHVPTWHSSEKPCVIADVDYPQGIAGTDIFPPRSIVARRTTGETVAL